jgi:pimeloyl-ACP methyl ester carboxylesterase
LGYAARSGRYAARIPLCPAGHAASTFRLRITRGLLHRIDSITCTDSTAEAFSETDFTEDLTKIDVPTLVLHGEDDQIVPVKDAAVKSARLIKDAKEIYYPGAPHGLTDTHQDQFNADLLAFLRS